MDKLSACFQAATGIVRQLTDRWVVAGAIAAVAYRDRPRLTTDVDILVEWHEDLVAALEAGGFDVRTIAMPDDHPHLLIAQSELGRADFIIPTVEYQEIAIDRGRADHVLTVEDVIIHKLIAGRPRDYDDVRSILRAKHELDMSYLQEWLQTWEVADRWDRVLRPDDENGEGMPNGGAR